MNDKFSTLITRFVSEWQDLYSNEKVGTGMTRLVPKLRYKYRNDKFSTRITETRGSCDNIT